MIPALDTRMEPVIFEVRRPFITQLAGHEFGYDSCFDIARKANELGMNGLRVTKMSITNEYVYNTTWVVRFEVEVARL